MKSFKLFITMACIALMPCLQAQEIVLWIADADGAPVVGQAVDVTLNIKCGDVEINDMFTDSPGDLGILTRDISGLFSGRSLDPKESCTYSYTVLVDGETVSAQDQPLPPLIQARTADKAATAEALQPPAENLSGNVIMPWWTRSQDNTDQQWNGLEIQDGALKWVVRSFQNQGGQIGSELIEIPPSFFTELDDLIPGERYTITLDAQGNFDYDAFEFPLLPPAKGSDKNYQLQVPAAGNPVWVDGLPPFPANPGSYFLETEVNGFADPNWRQFDPSLLELPPLPENEGDFSLKLENSSFSWGTSVPPLPTLNGTYALQLQNSGNDVSWRSIPPPPPQEEGFLLLQGEEDQNMNVIHSWTSDIPFVNREHIQNIGLPTEEFLTGNVNFITNFNFDDLQDQAANGTLPPGNFYEDPNTGKRFHSTIIFDANGNEIQGLEQVKPAQPLWVQDQVQFDTWHKQGTSSSRWNFPGSVHILNTSTTRINVTDGSSNYGLMTDDFVCAAGFVQTSDMRIKKNILSLQSSLAAVMNLHPKTYKLMGDESDRNHFGFLAQEVESAVPELVIEVDWSKVGPHPSGINGKIKTVNYDGFIPLLTKAMQEQQELIESQELRLNEQDDRIAELEAQLNLILEAIDK